MWTLRRLWTLLLVAGCLVGSAAPAEDAEVVELVPKESAGFSARNLIGLVRRQHYYGERKIRVETTPPHALLDLFYIRAGFQKLYEQAEAPAIVVLPKRIEASTRDRVMIRAHLDGFRHQSVSIPVHADQEEVLIELEPLPNRLEAVSFVYLAGRASIGLLVQQSPTARVQNREDGFNLILAETALGDEAEAALASLASPLVGPIEAQQLGEDLLVQVDFGEGVTNDAVELRSRQSQDPIRGLHRFVVDVVPRDGGAQAVERARAALAALRPEDVTRCSAAFDRSLRKELDPAALARALSPRGEFTDPYLRAALRRLGEISPGGVIRLADGSSFRPQIPLELGAAALQAASAEGYLGLLRRFVEKLEPPPYRDVTLRGLIAPELEAERFEQALRSAEQEEARCRGGGV